MIDNPYLFQGRPNFVFGSAIGDKNPKFTLDDHRNRFADPMTGRWMTRDPIGYSDAVNLFEYELSKPVRFVDPFGLLAKKCEVKDDTLRE